MPTKKKNTDTILSDYTIERAGMAGRALARGDLKGAGTMAKAAVGGEVRKAKRNVKRAVTNAKRNIKEETRKRKTKAALKKNR